MYRMQNLFPVLAVGIGYARYVMQKFNPIDQSDGTVKTVPCIIPRGRVKIYPVVDEPERPQRPVRGISQCSVEKIESLIVALCFYISLAFIP
jgi:hypothetical protein